MCGVCIGVRASKHTHSMPCAHPSRRDTCVGRARCTGIPAMCAWGGACTRTCDVRVLTSARRSPCAPLGTERAPQQAPRPGPTPHFHTGSWGGAGDTRPQQPPERQSDPTPPWVKALYLPDVLQGQLLMPVINYLRAFLNKAAAAPETPAQVTWAAGAHARRAGLGRAGPTSERTRSAPREQVPRPGRAREGPGGSW